MNRLFKPFTAMALALVLSVSACSSPATIETQGVQKTQPAATTTENAQPSVEDDSKIGSQNLINQLPEPLQNPAQYLLEHAVDDPKALHGPVEAKDIAEVTELENPSTPQLPVTVTDFQGTEVTVSDISRILALDLYGTLAETVTALGQGDRLIGRVTSSTQESLQHLPLVTENGHDLNVEAILELEPSVVLMDTTNGPLEITEQLRAAGVTVVHFTPDRTIAGISDQIKAVAAALGVPADGERLATQVSTNLELVTAIIEQVAPQDEAKINMAFLYVRGTAGVFFILADGSGADDLIQALSGRDVASESGAKEIIPANAEALVSINPELILTMSGGLESTGGLEGFIARPGVEQTTAGANQRIITMADGQILAFGPNTPATLLSLATAIYTPAGN